MDLIFYSGLIGMKTDLIEIIFVYRLIENQLNFLSNEIRRHTSVFVSNWPLGLL